MDDDHLKLCVQLARAATLPPREMPKPQRGDLVVEVTGFAVDPDGIGWLVANDLAPYNAGDPLDGSAPMREVWDVIPLSGRPGANGNTIQRWENANFRVVPADMYTHLECPPLPD